MIEIDIVNIVDLKDMSGTKFYHAIVTDEDIKKDVRYMTNPTNGKPHLSVEEFTELIKDEYGKV